MQGDVFGKGGDFITAPEVCQVFGEVCMPPFDNLILRLNSHVCTCSALGCVGVG